MPQYLVSNKDVGVLMSKYAIRVFAPSPEAAIKIFNTRVMSNDEGFREHVLSDTVNAGILESFFFQSEFEAEI